MHGIAWADCLARNLGIPAFNGESYESAASSSIISESHDILEHSTGILDPHGIICSIGSGHYVPKVNDAVRLALYSLIINDEIL